MNKKKKKKQINEKTTKIKYYRHNLLINISNLIKITFCLRYVAMETTESYCIIEETRLTKRLDYYHLLFFPTMLYK